MNILTTNNPDQTKIDLDRRNSYEVGDLVRATNRYGPSYCSRADGTGSSWSVVAGTVWYVASKVWAGKSCTYDLDDRCRDDVEGDNLYFKAFGVAGVNLEPVEKS